MTQITYNDIANNACDAIDILIENALNKTDFDKTIIGIISECIDASIGEYKIKVQDASYYATVSDPESKYSKGDEVYILIPGGDFSKPKKIIGSIDNLGESYIASLSDLEKYEIIGFGAVEEKEEYKNGFAYSSFGQDFEILENLDKIYDADNLAESKVKINEDVLSHYMKQASNIKIEAKIKTTIPTKQRNKGNFGIIVEVELQDDAISTPTIKTFILDINSMIGTIYNLSHFTPQSIIQEIDGSKYKRIKSIYLFTKDFQNGHQDKIEPADIFFDDVAIYAMADEKSELWNTYYLSLQMPQGDILKTDKNSLDIIANLTFKNQNISNEKIQYYWFLKNGAINISSIDYSEYGGQGWQCLNNYVLEDSKKVWKPHGNTFNITNKEMKADSVEYKCIAMYNNSIVAFKNFTIKNEEAIYQVELNSSLGTNTFYLDQGKMNLICNVKEKSSGNYVDIENLDFYWSKTNEQGKYEDLNLSNSSLSPNISNMDLLYQFTAIQDYLQERFANSSIDKKDRYFSYKIREALEVNIQEINNLLGWSENDIIMNDITLYDLYKKIENFLSINPISFINKNIYNDLTARSINNVSTFTCTVFTKENKEYIGSASIIIKNILDKENKNYSLTLVNGNQIFKYDASGKSPTHKTNTPPQTILPLSFELYDEAGSKINLESGITWKVPASDSMLKADESNKSNLEDYYIFNSPSLSFEIVDSYKSTYKNNDIILEIAYNDQIITQKTNLSFLKDGENGTNGTDYYCRIISNQEIKGYPTIFCYETEEELIVNANFINSLSTNINDGTTSWFFAELWNSGVKVQVSDITWKVLTDFNLNGITPLSIKQNKGESFIASIDVNQLKSFINENKNPYLTIQAEIIYNGKKYFATQTIALVYINHNIQDFLPYRIEIKEDCGFNEAMYSSDGTNPQYNTLYPFELRVYERKKEEFILEDETKSIQIIENNITKSEDIQYEWEVYGSLITLKDIDNEDNKKEGIPPVSYDGATVSNGIKIIITKAENQIAQMFFPIHFYLNRYGHSHLNDWDGNSIQISEDEGYLLSPQVGAGKKETDNTFTGMFMGEVKGGINETDKTGLLGYGHGVQTMFLDAETGSAYFGKNGEISIKPKDKDTEVKLGTWYLDKEAIWQSEDGTKIFGGDNPYFTDGTPNLYFGQKGLSLDNKMIFFNQGVKENINNEEYLEGRSPGTLKIGPWFVETSSFWKGDPDLGGGYLKWLNGTETYPKPEAVAEPIQVEHPGSRPKKPTEVAEPNEETGTEEEWQEYNDYLEALEIYEEAIKTYDSDLENYNQYLIDKEKYDKYLNELQLYEGNLQSIKKANAKDIYLGDSGFSLSNFLVYSSNENTLKIDGQLNCTNSLTESNDIYFLQIYNTEKEKEKNNLLGVSLAPNKLYFYDKTAGESSNSWNSGYIKYIYGTSYGGNISTSGSQVNGNHFYFNRPICVSDSIRFGTSGVQLLTIGVTSGNNPYFAVGPTRSDAQNTKYVSNHRIKYTYLRGRTMYLQAFGDSTSSSGYSGTIYGYAGRFVFYNKGKSRPYVSKAWTTSSDERLKNLKSLDERYYTFFNKLKPLAYTWKEDGENGKVNIGYSAQQVKQALFDSGLELNDFAGLSIDYDNEDAKKQGIEDYHTLSYEEFGPIYAAVLQRALKKIDELEERIKELEK